MNLPKISFFDDAKLEMWILNAVPIVDPVISGQLIKINKKGIPKEGLYALMGEKLAYKKKHINLCNITLEKTKQNGFRLTRNRKSIEFQA